MKKMILAGIFLLFGLTRAAEKSQPPMEMLNGYIDQGTQLVTPYALKALDYALIKPAEFIESSIEQAKSTVGESYNAYVAQAKFFADVSYGAFDVMRSTIAKTLEPSIYYVRSAYDFLCASSVKLFGFVVETSSVVKSLAFQSYNIVDKYPEVCGGLAVCAVGYWVYHRYYTHCLDAAVTNLINEMKSYRDTPLKDIATALEKAPLNEAKRLYRIEINKQKNNAFYVFGVYLRSFLPLAKYNDTIRMIDDFYETVYKLICLDAYTEKNSPNQTEICASIKNKAQQLINLLNLRYSKEKLVEFAGLNNK